MKKTICVLLVMMQAMLLLACDKKTTTVTTVSTNPPFLRMPQKVTGDTIEEKVASYLSLMTIEQKVGQMIQAEKNAISPSEVSQYNIGSLLSGAGMDPVAKGPDTWANLYNQYQKVAISSATGIPIIYGIDAVHGHNAVLGATLFPHNIGLGAANDPELMYRIGETTAEEMAITGINWNFSPTVAVVQNIQWGRAYESFGENPELQVSLVKDYVRGLQQHNRVATAKHFIGDGGTSLRDQTKGEWSIDQGNTVLPIEELKRIHLPGYLEALEADVSTVMISYSSFNGLKMHQNKELITGLLKEELGFKGFVISDYDAIKQIPNQSYYNQLVLAINAGVDMVMEPNTWKDAYKNIVSAVKNGDISEERINDAVGRILYVKYKHNIITDPIVKYDGTHFNTDEHKAIAREAVRKSLVLLKNENGILPLSKNSNILLLGPGSDDVKLQAGGWTLRWQGAEEQDTVPGTSILEAFTEVTKNNGGHIYTSLTDANKASVAVVVLAERPYAEGWGDNGYLELGFGENKVGSHTSHVDNLKALNDATSTGLPVVVILMSGRPLLVTNYLNDWDGFVAAWLPGSEGGSGIADVVFGDYDFTGKLPVTWPKNNTQFDDSMMMSNYNPEDYLFPYGYGLKYND